MTIMLTLPSELEKRIRDAAKKASHGDLNTFLLDVLSKSVSDDVPSDDINDPDGPTPWRGVFVVEPQRTELCKPFELKLNMSELPKWQPQVIIDPRLLEDDNE